MTHQDGPQAYGEGAQPGAQPGGYEQPQPSYGQAAYGQAPYAQAPYGQAAPYAQTPDGQVPYAQAPYGQAAYAQPGYGQPAYGQVPQQGGYYGPPAGYPYAPQARTNAMAVASLVLGILWIYWIGSILALVFGYIARNQIRERGENGAGMATAGIVLGWVGVGIFGIVVLAGIASYS